jgi:hypothetical protein
VTHRILARAALLLAVFAGYASADPTVDKAQLAARAGTMVERLTADWRWTTLREMLHPAARDEARHRDQLERGSKLGAARGCEGKLEDAQDVANAYTYTASCEFAGGRANVVLGFGVDRDGKAELLGIAVEHSAAEQAAFKQVGEVTATIVGRVARDWRYASLEPMLHPATRNEARFREPLERGRALGALVRCEGTLDDLKEIPNAIKYSGDCTFEHGRAKVYIGYGVGHDGQPVVFALDLFPVAAEAKTATQ